MRHLDDFALGDHPWQSIRQMVSEMKMKMKMNGLFAGRYVADI